MSPLVDAATLADHLGISRDTVYRHADELGVIRIGGRLRFDLERASTPAGESAAQTGTTAPVPTAMTPTRAPRSVAPLLPIRDRRAA